MLPSSTTPDPGPVAVMHHIRDEVLRQHYRLAPSGEPPVGFEQPRPSRQWRELHHKLWLASEHHHIVELPFESRTPVVGRLVAGLRQAWNSVACKWHVRRIVWQQNAFNLAAFETLRCLVDIVERQSHVIAQQQERLAALESGSLPADGEHERASPLQLGIGPTPSPDESLEDGHDAD